MKKVIIFLILFMSFSVVKAMPKTFERTENDLGVNKKWIINENNINNVYATPRVDANEKIYDFADVISEEDEKALATLAQDFVSRNKMDIVILTIDVESTYTEIESYAENYAADFYDYNDFGLNFEKYSGLIIVRNVNETSRYYNIFTFGNAQLYYPFERCENILDEIYNNLYNDLYLSGFKKFIESASNYYDAGIPEDMNDYYIDDSGYIHKNYTFPLGIATIVSTIITVVIMIILVLKNKMVKKVSEAQEYLDKESIIYTNRQNQFVTTHTTSYHVSSSSGSGGHSSFGGSSGGGHGGGGGRHG